VSRHTSPRTTREDGTMVGSDTGVFTSAVMEGAFRAKKDRALSL
jgi:hypothetical protein